jgi:hypothetical protein
MARDVPQLPELDTSGCGPGVDRCMRARTAPKVIIRCERHFLEALSAKPSHIRPPKPAPPRERMPFLRLIEGGGVGDVQPA